MTLTKDELKKPLEEIREEVERVLQIIEADGLDDPRDVDAAVDAIMEGVKISLSTVRD